MRVKGKYEISVWENPKKGEEEKLFVIGSDTMTSQNKVFSPIFTKNINGTMKLTFQMYYSYIDNITGEKVSNPYAAKLVNERFIKLKYDNQWYDFIIKNVKEDSIDKIFTYECVDLFYNELSRNGFSIEYDDSLNNNTKTAENFVKEVIDGTDWVYDETSDIIKNETSVPEIIYNSTLKRVLTKYKKDGKYYYVTEDSKKYNFSNLKSLISNGENFSDATSWQIMNSKEKPSVIVENNEKIYLELKGKNYYLNLGPTGVQEKISKGSKYILKIKSKELINNPNLYISTIEYDNEKGYYVTDKENPQNISNYIKVEDVTTINNTYSCTLTFLKDYEKDEIFNNQNLCFIIYFSNDTLLESIVLYKKIPYGDSYLSIDDKINYSYEHIYNLYPTNRYGVFDPKVYFTSDNIDDYEKVLTDEKIKTLNIKQSNRYNILQTISENFKCWIRFYIDHDENGKILSKKIKILNEIENDTGIAVTYDIDLNNISRTIDSTEYTTKLYVIPDTNSKVDSGICSISNSRNNNTGENFIYNFQYYTQNGLLDEESLNMEITNLSILLKNKNDAYKDNFNSIKDLEEQKINLQVSVNTLNIKKSSLLNTLDEKRADLAVKQNDEDLKTTILSLETDLKKVSQNLEEVKIILEGDPNDETNIGIIKKIDELYSINTILVKEKNEKIKEFENKYYAFIQEGTWKSTDYISDDEYYAEALEVLKESVEPKVTYDIFISQVSSLEEFENRKFNIGDDIKIIDNDFFFDKKNDTYKLNAIITELTYNLDDPRNDNIVVKNYKDRFEDIFERMAANTQKMEFAKADYDRASAAIKANKTIEFDTLQKTFDKNATIVQSFQNESIVQDSTGITISDVLDPSKKTKITSGGIFISTDGGGVWKNAIRGDGISTNLLTAGQIEVGKIDLYDQNYKAFGWDSNGIIAYDYITGIDGKTLITNFDKYAQFYKDGLKLKDTKNGVLIDKITVGKLPSDNNVNKYGFEIRNNNNEVVMQTDDDGNLMVRGEINATSGSFKGNVEAESGTFRGIVYADGGSFKGNVDAESGTFRGAVYADSGSFDGKINAVEGKIGKWNISEDGIEYIALPETNELIYIETSETSTSVKKYQLTLISNFSPFEEKNLIPVTAVLKNNENRKLFQYYKIKDINNSEINTTVTSTGEAYCEKIDGIYYFYGTQFPNTYSKIEPGNIETSGSLSGENLYINNLNLNDKEIKSINSEFIKMTYTIDITSGINSGGETEHYATVSFYDKDDNLYPLNNDLFANIIVSQNINGVINSYNSPLLIFEKGKSTYTKLLEGCTIVSDTAKLDASNISTNGIITQRTPSSLAINSNIISENSNILGMPSHPWKEVYSTDYYYLDSNNFKSLKEEFSNISSRFSSMNSTINNLLKIESTNVSIGDSTIGSLKKQVKAVIGNVALNQVTTDGPNFKFDKNFAPTTNVEIPVIVTYMDRNLLSYGKATLTIGLNSDKTSGIGTFISDTSVSGIIYSYNLNFGYEI